MKFRKPNDEGNEPSPIIEGNEPSPIIMIVLAVVPLLAVAGWFMGLFG
jgi:hypothetical protein